MPQQYPRKRISVACHYCRHRKRRCDGEKPQCALCRESDIECEYPKQVVEEALPRRETVSQNQKMLLRRLDQLENLLREKSQQPAHTRNEKENENQSEQPNCEVRYDEDVEDEEPEVGMEGLSYVEHQNASNDVDDRFHQMNESNQSLFLYPQNLNTHSSAITPDSTIWHETSPVSENSSCNTVEIHKEAPRNTPEIPEVDDQPFSIPDGHLTTTGSLFLLEPIRRLIGEYPGNFFYHIEAIREPPFEQYSNPPKEMLQNLNLETKTVDLLLSNFFTEVHIHFPILNPETFRLFFYDVMKQGPYESLEMALCLTVLALGKLAFSIRKYGSIHENKSENGLEYFAPAHQILLSSSWACFDLETTIPTGLLLSAIYLSYMSYPLPSWHLAYTASVKLQLIISHTKKGSLSTEKQEAVDRLCWACFIIECDTLAEFHLPQSGIEYVVHQMQFPYFHQRSTQDELLFLSLCSIRSLLNRIHHAIYAVSRPARSERKEENTENCTVASSPGQESLVSIFALECVISELTRQLDTWYSSLPDPIQPELDPQTPCSPVKKWLRSRYWSARHIITRPCLVYAISTTDPGHLPPFVMENSQLCIESCRNFVVNAVGALEKPSQYIWNMIQAYVYSIYSGNETDWNRCLSCALVLTAAARSPALQHLVLDLDDILTKVIAIARRWGGPNSSIQFVDWMLSTVQQRQRLHIVP